MQSLPYYAKRPSQGMVWQTTTKDYNFVPGAKQVVRQPTSSEAKGISTPRPTC